MYGAPGCLDINGDVVEWWFIYKPPVLRDNGGTAYAYYDYDMDDDNFVCITDQLLGRTSNGHFV